MQYRYIERCPMGYVEFVRGDERVRMYTGEAVEVPEWLGKKLATNNHFEAVMEDGQTIMAQGSHSDDDAVYSDSAPRSRGRPRKVFP